MALYQNIVLQPEISQVTFSDRELSVGNLQSDNE